jgi:hypothetical protein
MTSFSLVGLSLVTPLVGLSLVSLALVGRAVLVLLMSHSRRSPFVHNGEDVTYERVGRREGVWLCKGRAGQGNLA